MSENNTNENTEKNDEPIEDKPNESALSIDKVIDSFLHRILDIEECARDFISSASKKYNENAERLKSEISEGNEILKNAEERDKRLFGIKTIRKAIRDIDRHNNSSPVAILEKSLFIYLFAAFDKYIGDLVAVLYQSKPDLYKNINREISLSEALQYESMDELRQVILDKEIETLRRKGYIEQFNDLENKFSIKLTKFDNWPNFVERAQRRNLFTHCDGIVSKQYLDSCKTVGFKFKDEPLIGDQLKIGGKYFFTSCHLVTEVAIMLGHTLWRKILPNEIESADAHLSELVFNFLHMEHWNKAISLSTFALGQKSISSDEIERIFTVNHAIALKATNKSKAAKNVLDKKDWSATTYDFKLAYAVLTENYSDACKLMEKIGKQGELIYEISYHDWPLFRDFRDREEFFQGYLAVYGYKYSSKLSSLAEEKKVEDSNLEELN